MSHGEVGKCGVAVDSLARHGDALRRDRPRRRHDVDDDQLDGADRSSRCTSRWPRSTARRWAKVGGTLQNDILKEYIAQKEYIFPPRPSMRLITDQFAFCAEARAAVEHDLDLRVPHPRGGLDGAAGARLHAARRHRVRAVRHRRRARRRRLRAAALLLLQLAQRLLRGDRQVPRRAPHLGEGDARALRREGPALLDAALPHADGRLLADRAAAVQQRRAHGDPGARRRPRRDELAPHELARRDARAADRLRGEDRAPHAADHRPRVGRHQHDRPARRLLLRRGADDGWSAAASTTSGGSTSSAAWSRRSRRASRSARSWTPPTPTSARSTRRRRSIVGVNDFVRRRRAAARDPLHRRRRRGRAEGGGLGRGAPDARRQGRDVGARRPRGRPAPTARTSCRRSSRPSRPTRPSARSPTSCARSSRPTRSRRFSEAGRVRSELSQPRASDEGSPLPGGRLGRGAGSPNPSLELARRIVSRRPHPHPLPAVRGDREFRAERIAVVRVPRTPR